MRKLLTKHKTVLPSALNNNWLLTTVNHLTSMDFQRYRNTDTFVKNSVTLHKINIGYQPSKRRLPCKFWCCQSLHQCICRRSLTGHKKQTQYGSFFPRTFTFTSWRSNGITGHLFNNKPTDAGRYLHFKSNHPHHVRRGVFHEDSSSILAFVSVPAGTCLSNHCAETALVYPPISWSLHRSDCTR
jgi:hypothetical protein